MLSRKIKEFFVMKKVKGFRVDRERVNMSVITLYYMYNDWSSTISQESQ
jgi:hypothetical protein